MSQDVVKEIKAEYNEEVKQAKAKNHRAGEMSVWKCVFRIK